MTKSTTDKIIDFQAKVGSADADIGVVFAYIFAVILIIAGIGMAIYGLIPKKSMSCDTNTQEFNVKVKCDKPSADCTDARRDLANRKIKCNEKNPNYIFLLALLLIPLGVGIIFFAKWNRHMVKTNKPYAAISGTLAEAQILKNFIRN